MIGIDKILHLIVGITIFLILKRIGIYKVSCVLFIVLIAFAKEFIDFIQHPSAFTMQESGMDILATILVPYVLMRVEK